jgi:hypothetical protein
MNIPIFSTGDGDDGDNKASSLPEFFRSSIANPKSPIFT